MNVEKYIRAHPFPPNGEQVNNQLVSDIQNPSLDHLKTTNLEKLLENNARLIWVVYKQYNYGHTIEGVMGFVYEGLVRAAETYNPNLNVKFYFYALTAIRGIMQTWFNYNGSLVHVPVAKKKSLTHEYIDMGVLAESTDFTSELYDDENNLNDEFESLIKEYIRTVKMSDKDIKDLEILLMSKEKTHKEVSADLGVKLVTVRRSIRRAIAKLKAHHEDLLDGKW